MFTAINSYNTHLCRDTIHIIYYCNHKSIIIHIVAATKVLFFLRKLLQGLIILCKYFSISNSCSNCIDNYMYATINFEIISSPFPTNFIENL